MIGELVIYSAVIMALSVESSLTETLGNCTCGYYSKYASHVGPFCEKWLGAPRPWCHLAGREEANSCPGAIEVQNESLYYTMDESVCNKSTRPQPAPWSLGLRQPFDGRIIIAICVYPLNLLVGTVGNVLVIKYFSSEYASGRAGSRFVAVLAGVDFISSIWVPTTVIVAALYYHPVISLFYWNKGFILPNNCIFGEITCRVAQFYPLLFFATPWLLLAISLERARAVFRPFADRLCAKAVIIISTMILIGSFSLSMKLGLSFRYETNSYIYFDGTLLEYSVCTSNMNTKDRSINSFVILSLGVWLPMILIPIVLILTFYKLKEQARLRKNSSTQDWNAQLSRISRTFTVVLVVFYVCYLPDTITDTAIAIYYLLSGKNTYDDAVLTSYTVTTFLLFSNSCLNPVIYSKIHVNIYNCLKRHIVNCVQKSPCKKIRQTPPSINLANMVQP